MRRLAATALAALLVGCSGAPDAEHAPLADAAALAEDAGADASHDAGAPHDGAGETGEAGGDAKTDAAVAECWSAAGAAGQCMTAAACAAIPDRTATTVRCAGMNLECCVDTPDTADNPPIPAGYKLMAQSQVTPEMTTWAVSILHDPVTYRMFDTVTKTFGTLMVLARVEWHPPDFQNSVIHRGVTLYVPL